MSFSRPSPCWKLKNSFEAVTPVTGAARVVLCAPKVALTLGYDFEAALERLDS